MVFQECFKGISREIEGHFKTVLWGFHGYLKEVKEVCQGSFHVFSRKFQRSAEGVLRVFHGSGKGVLRVSGMFQGQAKFESKI